MKNASKAMNVAVNVLLWFVIIIAACFSIMTFATKSEAGVASLGGYTPMTVLTDSMKPEFSKDDLIIVKKTPAAELEVGDVISYWTIIENQKAINTHRIVEKNDSNGMIQFMTKGDANERVDDLIVSEGDIIGKYAVKIPLIGSVLGVLSSSVGFLVIIVLPLLLFFIWQLYKLIVLVIEMKKEAVKEAGEKHREELEAEIRKKLEAEAAAKAAENAQNNAARAEAPAKAEETKASEASAKAEEAKASEAPDTAEGKTEE